MQRGLWPGGKSRMSREAPVRFREGLGVQFPRATRLVVPHEDLDVVRRCKEVIADWLRGRGLELKPSKTSFSHALKE